MQAQELDIPTPAGVMNTWLFSPTAPPPRPAVLLLMDAPGIRPELKRFAMRWAEQGYAVLLPNLYYRLGRDVAIGPTRDHPQAAENMTKLRACAATLDADIVCDDVGALLMHLPKLTAVRSGPLAVVGYCMSGAYALVCAEKFPQSFAFMASFYGTRLVTQETTSPHSELSALRCSAYFGFAENDRFVTPAEVQTLQQALHDAGVAFQLEIYPGAEHGFAFEDRGAYQAAGATQHWQRLFELAERTLR